MKETNYHRTADIQSLMKFLAEIETDVCECEGNKGLLTSCNLRQKL